MRGKTKAVSIDETVYESVAAACKSLGLDPTVVTARVNSRMYRFRGWKWAPKGVAVEVRTAYKRRVVIDGVVYDSVTSAAQALKLNFHTVRARLDSVTDRFKNYRYVESDPKRTFRRTKHTVVVIHGVEYPSKVRAAQVLNVSSAALTYMLKHPKRHPGCYYKNTQTGEIIYLTQE